MIRTSRALTPARRDAALRRLRVANRLLIGATVVGTGVLAEVASAAFTGHSRAASAGRLSAQAGSSATHSRRRARRAGARRGRHHHAHTLRPPAQAPTSTSTPVAPAATTPASPAATSAAPAPATTAPAPAATAPAATPAPARAVAPAPAPVVSGGS